MLFQQGKLLGFCIARLAVREGCDRRRRLNRTPARTKSATNISTILEVLTAIDQNYWQRDAVLGLAPLLAGIGLLSASIYIPQALNGNADFRQLYSGGYMIRAGLRHDLYDQSAQHTIENSIVSASPQVLPINHPAYEYLLFLPFTFLSYKKAYGSWVVMNILGLAFCGNRLAQGLDRWLVFALIVGFAPTWATVLQGQDSVWFLVFLLLSMDAKTEIGRGMVLGFTAFRFHLLVPILIMFAVWKRWRVALGILSSAIPLAVLSVSIVGLSGTLHYVEMAAASTEIRKGPPANLYGFFQMVLGRQHSHVAMFLAAVCGIIFFWHASRSKPSLATAILMVPLASYYVMMHDLVVLLVPIAMFLRRSYAGVLQFAMPVIGVYPPVLFVCGLPSLFMLLSGTRQDEQESTNGAPYTGRSTE
jgi:hypothetical protein